ncbi:F0F1 ATP synthase subunit epsilon [Pelagibius litoralis]|uniref:ATP synthase epsilon chain n=1 Tax=Pelagibius litoralis TaxID=374515 RepID=A0A967EVS6_9PROT|nr:F0F1 ATP synthase subunit epsilon [Pelagibius litoralis]NIA68284.1 F0F1 ATP synthase subunit epsilon [Pelagibius litoralis]
MAEGKIAFELVSPERLLLSQEVEMVVVPGEEGDFGVLERHTPMISTLRPGVIQVHEGSSVTESIFVAGGFAEVTPVRCTVLAEEAVAVSEIDRGATEQRLSDARDDLLDAKDDAEKVAVERRIAVAEAMLKAAG